MLVKRILCPARVRRIPARFSWIDQRLVRERWIGRCSAEALGLYLFLLTVADVEGLSYYSDRSLVGYLPFLNAARLAQARRELIAVGWLAYESPFYQVLALTAPLERPGVSASPRRTVRPTGALQALRHALEGGHDHV